MMNDDAALCSLHLITLYNTTMRQGAMIINMPSFCMVVYIDGSYRIPWKSKQPVWQLKQIWQLQKTGMFDCLGPR